MDEPTGSEMPPPAVISEVAGALISTVGGDQAATILISQFGWDAAVLAIADLDDGRPGAVPGEVGRAMHQCVAVLARI